MNDPFRIHMLKKFWHDLGHCYFPQHAWPRIEQLDLADSAFVVGPEDVESYHWPDQVITLTSAASARLWGTFGSKELFRLECLKGVFVATLGDRKLYGGVFIESISAAAIQFPVIYLTKSGARYLLTLRPSHCWGQSAEAYRALDPGRRQLLEREDVRAFFEAQGKLRTD
jgi:hypothetical protein